jgi:hypothetical protein
MLPLPGQKGTLPPPAQDPRILQVPALTVGLMEGRTANSWLRPPLWFHERGVSSGIKWIVQWAGDFKAPKNQQHASIYHRDQAASRQQQLLSTCQKLKDICTDGKFETTKHSTIMEPLRIRADWFRKQGRLQEDDLEQIINDMKAEGTFKEDNGVNGDIIASDEHKRVMEAIK